VSRPPREAQRPWPPLITAGPLSRLTLARDIVLTAVMWLLFLLLIAGEIERPLARLLGIRIDARGLGYADLPGNWNFFLHSLAPFLGIASFLVVVLASFAIHTFRQRRKALRGPRPPPLRLGVEARHAELATSGGPVGEAVQARRSELARVEAVDARSLLMILGQLDQAALTDARSLKVTQVHLTGHGSFQIWPDR
jgi:hypothetical protein